MLHPSYPWKTSHRKNMKNVWTVIIMISPIKGIFKSFSDAPGGFKEELQEIQWSLGLEYTYITNSSPFVVVTIGNMRTKETAEYFSFGAGFKMSVFSLDAAYLVSTAQSNPLDQTLLHVRFRP